MLIAPAASAAAKFISKADEPSPLAIADPAIDVLKDSMPFVDVNSAIKPRAETPSATKSPPTDVSTTSKSLTAAVKTAAEAVSPSASKSPPIEELNKIA